MMAVIKALAEVSTLVGGGTPSRLEQAYFDGAIPWATPTDVTKLQGRHLTVTKETITDNGLKNSSAKLLPARSVLLTSRATIGFVAINSVPMATNQGFINFICGPDLIPEYLAYWLSKQREYLISLASGTTFKEVSKGVVKNLKIPLPPLAEQQRIVDILDRTASIQRLRAEADAKLRELIPALFVDMFGDPVTNPKGWSVKKFSQLGQLDRGKSRHRPRDAAELYDGPYPFIQTGDVAKSDGYIRSYSATYSELGLAQSKLWRAGTLCITIAANIAKTGILCFDACFPDSVVGYIPNNEALTEYIRAWLSFLQPTLEANAPQAAQKNINLEILRDLPVSLPPIELQTKFSDYVSALYSVRQQSEKSKASIILTNDSLLHELLG